MEYSALVFDDCNEVEDTYDMLLETIDLFANDENCTQIVVSCKSVWTLRLATAPKNKVMLVQRPNRPYVALLNGLKAIKQENVVVTGISTKHASENIDELLNHLSKYPAIQFDKDLQAFDTRLLMFCLQKAIESNLAITSYAEAVTLVDTPLEFI